MTAHMLEHLALTLVLGPALAAGAAGRLRVRPWLGLAQFAVLVTVLHVPASGTRHMPTRSSGLRPTSRPSRRHCSSGGPRSRPPRPSGRSGAPAT